MAINSIESGQNVLKNYKTDDWSKSSSIELQKKGIEGTEKSENFLNVNEMPNSFGNMLADSISKVNQLQVDANTAIELLATGKSKNIHETMILVERADIAFKTMNQIRMKVIDAYKEVMRMQI